MVLLILSGGSGTRLWPLSNGVRSKQFIKFFDYQSTKESMIQRMYRLFKDLNAFNLISVATSKEQISILSNQLGSDVIVSVEPTKKDTFPAILLAVNYLVDKQNIDPSETIVVCPVDSYVNKDYYKKIVELGKNVDENTNIFLLGIKPTYPSSKYGYIIPKDKKDVSDVVYFKEKPDENVAKTLIQKGALWNSGVFAFKIKYLLEKSHNIFNYKDCDDLLSKFNELDKISFDYAILEKEENIKVLKYIGDWKDIGTWNTLSETVESHINDKVFKINSKNTSIYHFLDIPILISGINNAIIATSPDGILITDKKEASYLKPTIEKIKEPIKYKEKSWGNYQIIDETKNSLTIKITLLKDHSMHYHSHNYRKEIWTIIHGKGLVTINDKSFEVSAGDTIIINPHDKHKIKALTNIQLSEIQIGNSISITDKIKHD